MAARSGCWPSSLPGLSWLSSPGWFIGARLYAMAIEEGRAALAREGVELACADESLGGFPARFEWRCSALSVSMANGAQVSGGALHTVAPLWNPLFAIAEWTGPFASVSGNGFEAAIDSALLRASVRLDAGLELERLSAVLDPFSLTLQGAPQAIASASQAELHMRQPVASDEEGARQPQAGDLDVALVVFGFESLILGGVDRIDLSVSGLAERLGQVRARSLQEALRDWVMRSGRITPLASRLRLDDLAINLDGDAVLNPDGRIDFNGSIATNDVAALVDLLGVDEAGGAGPIVAGARLFGRQTRIGDEEATELPLRVDAGAVSIGPVPLGVLPPLRF
jgi:hypothetical protein